MCQGLNSHYFHIIGDGHQPNSRGLYTHYKDSFTGGMTIPNIATFDHGTCETSSVFVHRLRMFQNDPKVNACPTKINHLQYMCGEFAKVSGHIQLSPISDNIDTWNLKHLFINGCFNWMIPNLYIGNGCFTKHPFKTGCLRYQVYIPQF